jgi:hypothetical protein
MTVVRLIDRGELAAEGTCIVASGLLIQHAIAT